MGAHTGILEDSPGFGQTRDDRMGLGVETNNGDEKTTWKALAVTQIGRDCDGGWGQKHRY